MLPEAARRRIYEWRWGPRRPRRRPAPGKVRFGSLRRLEPVARHYGMEWGRPIDRYYIEERFLAPYAMDVHGHVLEIEDNTYTRRFGGERVLRSDVLHVAPGYPKATITADLTCAHHIPSETFDCIIFTHTMQVIYHVPAVIRTLYRILKPGGVLLATCSGMAKLSPFSMERWGDYWRFTPLSARKLFTEVFPEECVQVQAFGNVLAATASLQGLVTEELSREELDHHDPEYHMVIAIRAVRPARESRAAPRSDPLTFDTAMKEAEKQLVHKDSLFWLLQRTSRKAEKNEDFLLDSWDRLKTLIHLTGAWLTDKYRVPTPTILAVVAALIYLLDPLDLIPDPVPVLGFVDDASVIAYVVAKYGKEIGQFRNWENSLDE